MVILSVRPLNRMRRRFVPDAASAGLESRTLQTALPVGFTESIKASGLVRPTSMDIAPDGRIFVAEQDGLVRIVDTHGQIRSQPFLRLAVDTTGECGLSGVVLDPNFAQNGYVYLYHTLPGPNLINRVSRFTASGDTALAGSERVLLDIKAPKRPAFPFHNGGAMHFAADGNLFVAVGDNSVSEYAPNLGYLVGKMLRIHPDGTIPQDNPFYKRLRGKSRAIWAFGLRNPFTFGIQRSTGLIYINDVGQDDYEEINLGVPGGNYGWPKVLGNQNAPGIQSPIYTYRHGNGPDQGCAITGGVFYEPASIQFPSTYVGQYFFADFCSGWIKQLDPASRRVSDFAVGAGPFVVDLDVGRDGALYYLARGEAGLASDRNLGKIMRIAYDPTTPPAVAQQPTDRLAPIGTPATFSVSAAGAEPFHFQWQKDGQDIPGAVNTSYTTPPVSLTDQGSRFRVVISNPFGTITSEAGILQVTAATPPIARIDAPAATLRYRGVQKITYRGEAFDSLGQPLPAGAFTWQVELHHNEHFHPIVPPTTGSRSGSFRTMNHGAGKGMLAYEITLTVTDPASGLSSRVIREIRPA